ncbi:MAG: sigma-70 family RNA polymerase sigma factor [Planctomycetes bacterium]|nr:sigma-70 family RNA polymerase sigma factor [Planctomycetota bacterium]
MPRNDRELIRACLDGAPRAWDELVERYGRLIYSIPRRLGLSEMDSEDVLQTALGIALGRLETLRDVDRPSAWLIRTTYRESWRNAKRARKHSELDENVADDQAPFPECESHSRAWRRRRRMR